MKWTIKYKNKSGEKMLKIIKINKKIQKKRSGKNKKKKNEREREK